MKTYPIGENRVLVIKKNQGQLLVTIKEKDSDKFIEITPSR